MSGNVYVTGRFRGTASFGSTSLTSSGDRDIYITKLDTDGNFLWAKKAGGTNGDFGRDITVDMSGNVYVTGTFYGVISFGNIQLTASASGLNSFIAKLDTDGNFLWAKKAGGATSSASSTWSTSIVSDPLGNTFITGYFTWTTFFENIQLTSNAYGETFLAKLDGNGNFVWAKKAGGKISFGVAVDSFENLYITGAFDMATSIGGTSLPHSGSNDIFITKLGDPCTPPLSTSVTLNENILTATLTPTVTSAIYQWVDCDNNEPIEGAVNQAFMPVENGNYAVEITVLSCTLTSDCITVNNLNAKKNEWESVQIYPNPSNGFFILQGGDVFNETISVSITDILGQEIKKITKISNSTTVEIDLTKEASGVYFIKINNGKSSKIFKLIKK